MRFKHISIHLIIIELDGSRPTSIVREVLLILQTMKMEN